MTKDEIAVMVVSIGDVIDRVLRYSSPPDIGGNMKATLESEVKASLVDGYLPCSIALEVARKLEVAPKVVGDVANKLGIRIINCQLDCFGLEKTVRHELEGESINETVAEQIKGCLVNGRLPCAVSFKLGKELGVSLKEIADVANRLKIKIFGCQLGCFP